MAQKLKPEPTALLSACPALVCNDAPAWGASCLWKTREVSLCEGEEQQRGKVIAITGQIATNIYVKHMEIRTNSREEKANIEQGPALRLNKQWEMRSWLQ